MKYGGIWGARGFHGLNDGRTIADQILNTYTAILLRTVHSFTAVFADFDDF